MPFSGIGQFRSEIVWKRSGGKSDARRWGITTDRLLFYTKSDHYTWNRQYQAHDPKYIQDTYRYDDQDGRGAYTTMPLHASGLRGGESGQPWGGYDPASRGNHWRTPTQGIMSSYIITHGLIKGWPDKYPSIKERLEALDTAGLIVWSAKGVPRIKTYLSATQGIAATDLIADISMASGKERLGYATQKPIALLQRIIEASSNPDDVVLDPFAGCATTIEAAHRLGRKWIGIDIAIHAIKRVAQVRLNDRCGLVEGRDYEVDGVPRNVEGAHDLWERDKYHFQKWAVEQVDGFVTTRRTGDGGIDGRVYFYIPDDRDLQSMVLEVKGGKNVNVTVLRDLRGVLENDDALMAGLIIMEPLGVAKERNFKKLMAGAGDLEVHGMHYPRMQLLTVEEILEGKRFNTPNVAVGRREAQPRLPV